MESVVTVQKEPLYTQEDLQSFKDLIICSDHGESRSSNSMLLSIASQRLYDLLSSLMDSESELCVILCGYSSKIVNCLDEYSHTGKITLSVKDEWEVSENVEDLKSDFECLGVYAPSNMWILDKNAIKEEVIMSEKEVSEFTDFHGQNNFNRTFGENKTSVINEEVLAKLHSESKLGSDGFFLPGSFYKFVKADPNSSRFICPICETACFKHFPDFKTHLMDFHKECVPLVPLTYVCQKCTREFDSVRRWFQHTSKTYCPKGNANDSLNGPLTNSVFADPNNFVRFREGSRNGFIYSCPLCDTVFNKGYQGWERHVKLYHKEHKSCLGKRYQCDECSKRFSAGNYLKHKNGGYCQNSAYCKLCGKYFGVRHLLVIHLKNFHTEETVSCEKCGTVVKNKEQLKAHILRNHGKPVACDQCGKIFKAQERLKRHILTVHTEDKDKPYHCSICGKGFGRKGQLEIHERNHRNEKPYKCRFCDYASSSVGNRWIHEKNVHKDRYQQAEK